MKGRKAAKRDRMNKAGEIDENIREGKIGSTRKELVGLYYLSHIVSILGLYQFWCLVIVFYVVYRWRTPVKVSSENPIHVLTILFHLSVSPPFSWRLMMLWKILNSTLSMDMGSWKVPPLRNKSSVLLPLRAYPRKCKGVSSCPIYLNRSPPTRNPLPRHNSRNASYRYFLMNFTLI